MNNRYDLTIREQRHYGPATAKSGRGGAFWSDFVDGQPRWGCVVPGISYPPDKSGGYAKGTPTALCV